MIEVHHGDCIEVMRGMPCNSIDAIVTDPPYGLGFMGKAWDALPPGEEWARECLRVLKPGGHLLAFGGTRTWHRLAVAVEDAGFDIRDSIAWMHGGGFPKSLDVSKAIDKHGGNPALGEKIGAAVKAARESRGWTASRADEHFCGGTTKWSWFEGRKGVHRSPTPADFARIVAEWPELAPFVEQVAEVEREVIGKAYRLDSKSGHVNYGGGTPEGYYDITAPATDAARRWSGWGTALRPAFEPIVIARKPFRGTVAANVVEFGTGAINIDATRNGERWPANVILDESQEDALAESRYFYVAKAPKSERPVIGGVAHVTVKPLALMRWLVKLVTPAGGTVLEPFAGSGTTVEACILEGFHCIAIEREAEYLPLIQARIERQDAA